MTTATQTKCACPSCLCPVSLTASIEKAGKQYCSTACADGHPNGTACGNSGCGCNK